MVIHGDAAKERRERERGEREKERERIICLLGARVIRGNVDQVVPSERERSAVMGEKNSIAGNSPLFIMSLRPMSHPPLGAWSPALRAGLSSFTERCSAWKVSGLEVHGAVLRRKGPGLGARRVVLKVEGFGAKDL